VRSPASDRDAARTTSEVGIHSQQAWVAALVLMAAADLVVRALILWQRRDRHVRWSPAMNAAQRHGGCPSQ
jgi:hypothetical protein